MYKKISYLLKFIIFIETIIIIFMIIDEVDKISNKYYKLNKRIDKLEITSKLYYEDILQLLERK